MVVEGGPVVVMEMVLGGGLDGVGRPWRRMRGANSTAVDPLTPMLARCFHFYVFMSVISLCVCVNLLNFVRSVFYFVKSRQSFLHILRGERSKM